MKKILLIIMGIILLGLVTAGAILSVGNFDIKLNKPKLDVLNSYGISNFSFKEYGCNDYECKIVLYPSNKSYQPRVVTIPLTDGTKPYSDAELIAIAKIEINKTITKWTDSIYSQHKFGDGVITLS